jgi:pimeloyl-ACP methyl ester carboxylesterase
MPSGRRRFANIGAVEHQIVPVNDIRLHVVTEGEGPLVLLVHGFPESWYSWRHQLPVLAAAGFRAVAIDVRGYGRSSAPPAVDAYRMLRHVADNVALVRALGADEAVVVGHDWGAPIAWNSALARPDVFRAVAGLSVPFAPAGDTRPTDAFRAMAGNEEFYIEYFQQPGRAERELDEDVRRWLLGFYFTASGDAPPLAPGAGTVATIPHGAKMRDRFAYPDPMPVWLTEDDLDVYASEFEHTGFTGGLNRYRNVDRDWEDLAVFRGLPIEVPALFVGGDRDGPTIWGTPSIERFPQTLPRLHASIILPGCGHWTQQERPAEVNEALLDFLAAL